MQARRVRRELGRIFELALRLDDTRSLPTAVVVVKDVVTFGCIVLAAAAVDSLLERVRGPSLLFVDIRFIADLFLALLAIVYLVEAVVFVLIDVWKAIQSRLSNRRDSLANRMSPESEDP